MEFKDFLETVFDKEFPIQERLDLIYETVDDLLLEARYEAVDQIFRVVSENYITECMDEPALAVGFLTVSRWSDGDLRYREQLYKAIREGFANEYSEEVADTLVGGLEE